MEICTLLQTLLHQLHWILKKKDAKAVVLFSLADLEVVVFQERHEAWLKFLFLPISYETKSLN